MSRNTVIRIGRPQPPEEKLEDAAELARQMLWPTDKERLSGKNSTDYYAENAAD
jgi:hypothetical protein